MTEELWLLNATVCDPTTTEFAAVGAADPVGSSRVSIVITDGVIAHVGPDGPTDAPSGARTIDLGGRFVMPGLFDAHAHVTSVEAAGRALRGGVTAIRSAGVEGFQDAGLRILSMRRPDLVPQMFPVGLVAAPSIEDGRDLLLTDPSLAVLMGGARLSLRDIAEPVIALNASKGAFAVKTHATARAGIASLDPQRLVCDRGELAHVVEVASRYGLPVMCHAHGSEGCRIAVDAGVASIEHGTFADEAALELMAERGTWLVPTLSVLHDMAHAGGEYTDPQLRERGKRMLDAACDTVQRAVRIGVRIAAGTDTRYTAKGRSSVAGEVRLLVDAGMPVRDALIAATGGGGMGALNGLMAAGGQDLQMPGMRVGQAAGLVVLDGDPRRDVRVLLDPRLVIHRGRIVGEHAGLP